MALIVALIVALVALWQTNHLPGLATGDGESTEVFTPIRFSPPATLRKNAVAVVRVVDGDTIVIIPHTTDTRGHEPHTREERIRLIGVNTPELHVVDERPPDAGAVAAARWLESALQNDPQVELEYDEERKDRFGRTLAYVWMEREGMRRMLNEDIIRAGHGKPKFYPPNIKHKTRLLAARP